MVITADGGYRRGSIVPLKKNVDDALKGDAAAGAAGDRAAPRE